MPQASRAPAPVLDSTHVAAEVRYKPARTSLRLLAVLNVSIQVRPATPKGKGSKRLASRPDHLLTHFALPALGGTIEPTPRHEEPVATGSSLTSYPYLATSKVVRNAG